MDILRIRGGNKLAGEVEVSGSKNAALPQFAAALLSDQETILENVPDLSDIRFMAEIISHLGADISKIGPSSWKIHPLKIHPDPPYELVRKMRASICLLGPLVARVKRAKVPMPGGCVIGHRPIDLHLHALKEMGAEISLNQGIVEVDGSAMKAGNLFIGGRHGSTVTGTANAIMAAVLTPGITTLDGAACEPEIVDLCCMLKKMGAKISGAGSHLLSIEGVDQLNGCVHRVIPDRIEAATYMIGAAMTRGKIVLKGIEASHLGAFSKVMRESGVLLNNSQKGNLDVQTDPSGLSPFEIITLPYPGFPTDLQAQACALACTIPGLSILTERVYPSRFMHIPELLRMGATVSLEGANAIIKGGKKLNGAPVMASDLRASAALILAGLAAEGETWVHRIYHLDRGYEFMDEKLRKLGAEVERLPESSLPPAFRRPTD
ncbi:MAG: UDP-N-acetylglucosamine 1-carboxyvinyltransferase [Verrucomicrobia bacterium]|jgi:UDP-N-acetylglucosamine 1-carboxyvinyltransferase|nr:UDP-N-acetylglucosamine 1-carboxyvinyltransferase [Verrucomicrobiota bacterium]MDA0905358.1 UDP-N-acetylglucosamine 1-carboxyvinyltransferase [Verrucomicrobiota bacterium]MDA1078056.1 UDP-N-acetylglucosamine 1-carboxyvinyltransferase [Verrucomicrobiota bacterium]